MGDEDADTEGLPVQWTMESWPFEATVEHRGVRIDVRVEEDGDRALRLIVEARQLDEARSSCLLDAELRCGPRGNG